MNGASFKPAEEVRAAQCSAVLGALREGPRSTASLHALGVLAPAARVLDLRREGFAIETQRRGRFGVYVLLDEARQS